MVGCTSSTARPKSSTNKTRKRQYFLVSILFLGCFRSQYLVAGWVQNLVPLSRRCVIRANNISTKAQSSTDSNQATASSASAMQKVPNLRSILNTPKYSTLLLDMWGVMHDGTRPYPGVLEAISHLKAVNKKMVILSNSSKRKEKALGALKKMGFNPDDFVDVITSGEVSHQMLSGDSALPFPSWPPLSTLLQNKKSEDQPLEAFVLGSGDGDEDYCQSAKWTLSPPSSADLIIARGTFTINDGTPEKIISKSVDGEEAYFQALHGALDVLAQRRVPMLVCNPDKVRPDKGLPPMPGALGDAYEKALQNAGLEAGDAKKLVKRVGKPYREVYHLALAAAAESTANGEKKNVVNPENCLMVGDALETDVTGGITVGCATLWILNTGIHGGDVKSYDTLEEGAKAVLNEFHQRPSTEKMGEQDRSEEANTPVPTFFADSFTW